MENQKGDLRAKIGQYEPMDKPCPLCGAPLTKGIEADDEDVLFLQERCSKFPTCDHEHLIKWLS